MWRLHCLLTPPRLHGDLRNQLFCGGAVIIPQNVNDPLIGNEIGIGTCRSNCPSLPMRSNVPVAVVRLARNIQFGVATSARRLLFAPSRTARAIRPTWSRKQNPRQGETERGLSDGWREAEEYSGWRSSGVMPRTAQSSNNRWAVPTRPNDEQLRIELPQSTSDARASKAGALAPSQTFCINSDIVTSQPIEPRRHRAGPPQRPARPGACPPLAPGRL